MPPDDVAWRPLVTVVTPSFNYARFLRACLDSVRSQRYPRIEHIVVDGGSTDGSIGLLEERCGPGLRLLVGRDDGQADALNKGFALAAGQVYCWLNADDYWLHERVVEEAVDALRGGHDLVSAGGVYVDAAGSAAGAWPIRARVALAEIRYRDTLFQPSTFWRSAVHRPLRAEMRYAFDWKLWLELRRRGARFLLLERAWAAYRLHAGSKTVVDPPERRAEVAAVLGEEFGTRSAQYRWARLVARGMRYSEEAAVPWVGAGVRAANRLMSLVSRRRIASC